MKDVIVTQRDNGRVITFLTLRGNLNHEKFQNEMSKGHRFGSKAYDTVANGKADDFIAPFNCKAEIFRSGNAHDFSIIRLEKVYNGKEVDCMQYALKRVGGLNFSFLVDAGLVFHQECLTKEEIVDTITCFSSRLCTNDEINMEHFLESESPGSYHGRPYRSIIWGGRLHCHNDGRYPTSGIVLDNGIHRI